MVLSSTAKVTNLRQGDDRFRLLVQSGRDCAIFMLDPGPLLGGAKLARHLTERRQRSDAAERSSQQRDEIEDADRNARMEAQRATRIKDRDRQVFSMEHRATERAQCFHSAPVKAS